MYGRIKWRIGTRKLYNYESGNVTIVFRKGVSRTKHRMLSLAKEYGAGETTIYYLLKHVTWQ